MTTITASAAAAVDTATTAITIATTATSDVAAVPTTAKDHWSITTAAVATLSAKGDTDDVNDW